MGDTPGLDPGSREAVEVRLLSPPPSREDSLAAKHEAVTLASLVRSQGLPLAPVAQQDRAGVF